MESLKATEDIGRSALSLSSTTECKITDHCIYLKVSLLRQSTLPNKLNILHNDCRATTVELNNKMFVIAV